MWVFWLLGNLAETSMLISSSDLYVFLCACDATDKRSVAVSRDHMTHLFHFLKVEPRLKKERKKEKNVPLTKLAWRFGWGIC